MRTQADGHDFVPRLKGNLPEGLDNLAIWRLQSLFVHLMLTFQRGEVIKLFNKGALVGSDAARRYFLRGGQGEEGSWAPGVMILHESINPVIVFNDAGDRAKGLWLSPGLATVPIGGKLIPTWNYGKFDMEYLGLMYPITDGFSMLAAPTWGAAYDHTGSYSVAVILSIVASLAGAVLVISLRERPAAENRE
jgi:hypothetical protein